MITDKERKSIISYVKKNVESFKERYSYALSVIGRMRCSLQSADCNLYYEINKYVVEYCEDYGLNPNEFDVEEEF